MTIGITYPPPPSHPPLQKVLFLKTLFMPKKITKIFSL